MAVFSRMYSFVSIDQLSVAVEISDFTALPAKSMLVTLDDGHVGNAQLFETIRKYHVPAVIYAVAGVVNTTRGFWFDRLPHGCEAMQGLKVLPDTDRRSALNCEYGHTDKREYETATSLTSFQLRQFIEMGGTVGSHTLFHPLLGQCDDEMGQKECQDSRSVLEQMLNVSVRHFALPCGHADLRTRAWVAKAGYSTCRTTDEGWVLPENDPLALPNFGVSDTASTHKAVVQACGLWYLMKRRCFFR
jgi:peptidoglycan/xylan/chitin deacetylase (PgdA/CDA1 family)